MKCIYCHESSGFFKNLCKQCKKLVEVMKQAPKSFGYREMLEQLLATDVPSEKIEKFLDTDVDGGGSLNDQLTARMTNEVMTSLGQPSNMTADSVKQVKKDIAEGRAPSLVDHDVTSHGDVE
ncbi:MAG: hypothetical protein IPJ69_07110 [Deltaproteobacteria bacterium]|nr:MAG: hypothetical protein IPJ69_07110 [Deltaproteobacteria bacterium]